MAETLIIDELRRANPNVARASDAKHTIMPMEDERFDSPHPPSPTDLASLVVSTGLATHHDHRTHDDDGNDQSEDALELGSTKYEFRPQTRGNKSGFTTTWIDEDQTGDFDPSEELRRRRLQDRKVRARRLGCDRTRIQPFPSCDEGDADDEAPPKVSTRPSLICSLKFESEAGRAKFKELVENLPPETPTSDGYSLRKRKHSSAFRARDVQETAQVRSSGLPDDPTGHPAARGCWGCANLGHRCPLLDDELGWPCYTCWEDGEDCGLIQPPSMKRGCQHCERRRVDCSYKYTFNHGDTCQQCQDAGHYCIAGPFPGTIRTRLRYDRDWEKYPFSIQPLAKLRKVTACTECREADRECSFALIARSGEACESCKTTGDNCTVKSLKRSHHPKPKRAEKEKTKPDEDVAATTQDKVTTPSKEDVISTFPQSRTTSEHPKKPDPKGSMKHITTKFSHPIVFNCEEQTSGEPCDFCADATFALRGHEVREVEVIEWSDGSGLTEVHGGHGGDGVPNTRVCTSCILERLPIIDCPKHEIRLLPGRRPTPADEAAAFSDLLSGTAPKNRHWCSICPILALYECHTVSDEGEGCGLKLCDDHMVSLMREFDGNLQTMLIELKDEPTEKRILGLRADYEFLKEDGLLMRYVLGSTE